MSISSWSVLGGRTASWVPLRTCFAPQSIEHANRLRKNAPALLPLCHCAITKVPRLHRAKASWVSPPRLSPGQDQARLESESILSYSFELVWVQTSLINEIILKLMIHDDSTGVSDWEKKCQKQCQTCFASAWAWECTGAAEIGKNALHHKCVCEGAPQRASAGAWERRSVGAGRKAASFVKMLYSFVTRSRKVESDAQQLPKSCRQDYQVSSLRSTVCFMDHANQCNAKALATSLIFNTCLLGFQAKRSKKRDVAGAKYHARCKLQPNDTPICSEKVGNFMHGGWNHDRIKPGLLLPSLPDEVPNSESRVNGWKWNGCPKVPSVVGMWHMPCTMWNLL